METNQTARKPQPNEIIRRAELNMTVREIDIPSRKVSISFSSETPVNRYGYSEILSHSPDAIDLSRIEAGLCVCLFNHDKDEVLGRIENVTIDQSERKAKADIIFDADADTETIFQKVVNGTLKGISVGYVVSVWEEVAPGAVSSDGRFTGPCDIAMRWTPYEISVVSIPADGSVGVGRDMNTATESAGAELKSEVRQLEEIKEVTPAAKVEVQRDFSAEAVEIMGICRGIESLDASKFVSEKMTPDAVRKLAIDALKVSNAPTTATTERAKVGDEAIDKFTRAASDGMALRYGIQTGTEKPAEGSQELRGMPIRSLMAEFLSLKGDKDAHRMAPQEIAKRALAPGSQFLAIVDNTLNKSMMNAAATVSTTYQQWTGKTTVTDFKSVNMYRLSEAGGLEKVLENGEVKYSTMLNDEKVSMAVDTYGRMFGFTRQMIINDDIGYFMKAPGAYARAAYRDINTAVYLLLTSNAAIYDGQVLFDNASYHHNAVVSSGSLPTVAAFNAMATAMGTQKDISATAFLNLMPKYFISGFGASFSGKSVLNSTADPAAGGNAGVNNPWLGAMTPITDAAITSTTAWYSACDPNVNDTITVGYLNGIDTPTIEQVEAGGEILGTAFRIYFDWGVTVADFRGLYYNVGT